MCVELVIWGVEGAFSWMSVDQLVREMFSRWILL